MSVYVLQNSAVAGIPFISVWFFTTAAGWTADVIRERKLMSTLNVRRILIVIGETINSIFVVIFETGIVRSPKCCFARR